VFNIFVFENFVSTFTQTFIFAFWVNFLFPIGSGKPSPRVPPHSVRKKTQPFFYLNSNGVSVQRVFGLVFSRQPEYVVCA
jgi:hypothetical protein